MSTSAMVDPAALDWPLLPTETEIYILPDGRVIIADLPLELAGCLPGLGVVAPRLLSPASAPSPDEPDLDQP